MKKSPSPETDSALIVVDVENDFLPGGALGVRAGDQVIAPMNRAIDVFLKEKLPVLYSRDWHPRDHSSFQQNGGPWPPHCVQDTEGARFSSDLSISKNPLVFSKGTNAAQEEYSAFHARDTAGNTVSEVLERLGVRHVFIGGLATDYCVLNTALDLLKAGYRVTVLTDACRAVNVAPHDGEKALEKMIAAGAMMMTTQDLGG
ncbi:MAG: nicotinamidase [Deltaproteobacteria bacterium]|nr:nicotinamidase [Deltaproteobacteria bacterium]